MRNGKSALLTIILFSMALVVPAQTTESAEDKAKKKKALDERVIEMVDQSISDANGLRLPQNRAVVFAMAGDLYWRSDKKRARELFRQAASEIVNYNAEAERERMEMTANELMSMPPFEMFDPNDVRNEVLQLVSTRDAELALDLLLSTRSASLADTVARAMSSRGTGEFGTFDQSVNRGMQEITFEQRFTMMAADQNPEAAVKLIKDSLSKGVTPMLLPQLQKLSKTDEKAAVDLGSEILRRLATGNLATNQQEFAAALSFLQYAARPVPPTVKEKPYALPIADVRELASRMVTVALQLPVKSIAVANSFSQALPTLEKLVPEKAVLLKQRSAENQKNLTTEIKTAQQRMSLFSGNSTPEEMLAQMSRMSEAERRPAYSMLTMKINQLNDDARAKRLIEQMPDAQFRASAMDQFEATRLTRMGQAGKVEEARRMIGTLTSKTLQVQNLVRLSMQFKRTGTKADTETAASIMADAKALINEYPVNEDELANLMDVVGGYSTVDPEVAFRLFEPMIDEFNGVIQAGAVLSKYNKRDRAFKNGELVMRVNGNPGSLLPFRYIRQMQMLGKADLERMSTMADRFGRADLRTIARLYVIQGFIREDRTQPPMPPRP